jgi:hypothetical protein
MTDTITEPVGAAVTLDPVPRCEALLQCADKCCDPAPCGRPAVARVSFECTTAGCERASHVLLLCASCADQTAATQRTRRPL